MTIKTKSKAQEHSLAELRKINMGVYAQHNKLDQILQEKKREVDTLREQLYVEVQNFREAHAAEVRRSIEWSVEMANKSLPWWKRSLANIRERANAFMVEVQDMVKVEVARIGSEVKAAQDAERAQAEKDQAALQAVRAGNVEAKPTKGESDNGLTTGVHSVEDDGYGRPAVVPNEALDLEPEEIVDDFGEVSVDKEATNA